MLKVYCEHNAFRPILREYQEEKRLIELYHFSYDPNSKTGRLKRIPIPSALEWKDLTNVGEWDPLTQFNWSDFPHSQHFDRILAIVGNDSRPDALHIDSAFKEGCRLFVTTDKTDILSNKDELEALLGIRFTHPDYVEDELKRLLD